MEKTKVNTPNGPVDAMELEFKMKNEPWTTIELEDKTIIRARVNIGKVYRLEQYDQLTGEPAYQIASKLDIRSSVPSKLKKFVTFPQPSNEDVR